MYLRARLDGALIPVPLGQDFDRDSIESVLYHRLLGFEPDGKWIVVDIGANIGLSTIRFATLAARKGGHVIAIEPNSNSAVELWRNVRAAGLTNVTPINVAVSNSRGNTVLYVARSNIASSLSLDFARSHTGVVEERQVRSVTVNDIGDYVQRRFGTRRIDLLLLDVEGVARNVLEGASQMLKEQMIYRLKIDLDLPTDQSDVSSKLKDFGYQVTRVKNVLYATCTSSPPHARTS